VSHFVEQAIAAAGLRPLLDARKVKNFDAVRGSMAHWQKADLLVLGALADLARAADVGDEVRVHEDGGDDVAWACEAASDLEVLREVAVLRIGLIKGMRIGVDWGKCGIELAQVALGFGASDLRGPITNKRGLYIFDDEMKKVKGEGMIRARELARREIGSLVKYAGRNAVFLGESGESRGHVQADAARATDPSAEVAGA
jgi:hypothetical protein